jgi:CheY-like chemotaxis protein
MQARVLKFAYLPALRLRSPAEAAARMESQMALSNDLSMEAPKRRVLVVDDDDDLRRVLFETLSELAADSGMVLDIEQANGVSQAENALARRHFNIASLDMMMPLASGRLSLDAGVELARLGTSSGAAISKLIAYSGYLAPEKEEFAELMEVLPKIDRYVKTADESEAATARTETLTPAQWSQRILDYLQPETLQLTSSSRDRPPSTCQRCWHATPPTWNPRGATCTNPADR